MTFQEEERLAKGNKVEINKSQTAEVLEGKSVFRERRLPMWKFWKRRRNLSVYVDETLKMAYLDASNQFRSPFGTMEDIQRHIAGEIAKAKAKQKAMEIWEFFIIIGLLGLIAVLQLKQMGFLGS